MVVYDRKVGVMSNGKATFSIPAYNFADGEYAFVIVPAGDPKHPLAGGTFRKASGTGARQNSRGQAGEPSSPPAGASNWVGKWRGINPTAGLVIVSPDGTYTFNVAKGTCRSDAQEIVFSGPLSAWNGGKAKLREGVLAFVWQSGGLGVNQFHFAKEK